MPNPFLLNTSSRFPVIGQRRQCVICGYKIPQEDSPFSTAKVFCNVRAFQQESFTVWRCPDCQTIHSLEIVDLNFYYAEYPFAGATLNFPLRLCYQNLLQQLTSNGFSPKHRFLDYGCANGLFIQYLQTQGFEHCHGYDPYADPQGLGNPQILQQRFDYILLQDVIEHVEIPQTLLVKLDQLLKPGGYILIGTPNASHINLLESHRPNYYNSLHVPYHLHIYTPDVLIQLGADRGWQVTQVFDRPFHDTHWFGLNSRAWNFYQALSDGTLNVIFEEIDVGLALRSPRFWWYALFGYWLSLKTDMAVLFHKPTLAVI
ncbi:MAG: class I SAM-dependent methyltransferase [Symploca sp. SIO2D2]|nr:class I SAM-dependent methyltransferase [Symploca sp. SIO2D2]